MKHSVILAVLTTKKSAKGPISGSLKVHNAKIDKKADEALYLSKRTDRNRVSYSPTADTDGTRLMYDLDFRRGCYDTE
jgi:hypothetical protein